MAKLIWDKDVERLFETGVDHGILFPQKNDGTYDKGVAWNGLTAVNESPSGAEPNDMYADNMLYATLRSAEKYEATIEAYMYPPEFAACDGTAELATGVVIGGQTRQPFGFAYRTKVGNAVKGMEHGYKLHLVYGLTANPSEKNYETVNEDPDAMTFSWEVTSTPVPMEGYQPVSHIVVDSTKVDAAKYTALENMLIGDTTDSKLPTPDEVKTMMTGS